MASGSVNYSPLAKGEMQLDAPGVYMKNLVVLGFSFFLCFTAFSGIQNLVTSLLKGGLGYYSLGSLYLVFTISCLAGPAFVKTFGPIKCMFTQFCFICLFSASCLDPTWYTFFPASILVGFGASFLWVSQGEYVTWAAHGYAIASNLPKSSAIGLFNGIFYGMFQMTQVSGNLIQAFLLSDKSLNQNVLFAVYLGCAALGTVLILTLKRKTELPDPDAVEEALLVAEEEEESVTAKLAETVQLMVTPKMALIIPMILYNGFEMSFAWGAISSLIVSPILGKSKLGFVMCAFGVADALGSTLVGKLSDVVGRMPVVLAGAALQTCLGVWLLLTNGTAGAAVGSVHGAVVEGSFGAWPRLLLLAAGWGLGDAVWNTLISSMMGTCYGDKTEAAFSNFKLWQSLAASLCFFLQSKVPLMYQLYIILGTLAVAIPCYLVAECSYFKDDMYEEYVDEEHREIH